MDKIDDAYESVASGSVSGAVWKLAGSDTQKVALVKDALRLAAEFDDEDWQVVKAYLSDD